MKYSIKTRKGENEVTENDEIGDFRTKETN